jgi:hypothetical protein
MFDTKTPRTVDIIEDARLKTRLAELGRRQRETAERLKDQHQTDEQIEAERFQAESNALAEKLPKYAAARAASTKRWFHNGRSLRAQIRAQARCRKACRMSARRS